MHVRALGRFPVKSMQGETLRQLTVTDVAVEGDRAFGVYDVAAGTVVSAKRDGRLLEASARWLDGDVVVAVPGRGEYPRGKALDEQLSQWLGRPLRLVDARSFGVATFESPAEFDDPDSAIETWESPGYSFVDDSALHVVTTGDLEVLRGERPDLQWDVRRFRPNVVVEGAESAAWLRPGVRVALGGAEIVVERGCSRCVMTTRSQPGALERQLDVLRQVVGYHGGDVGVRARVVRAGTVELDDPVEIVEDSER